MKLKWSIDRWRGFNCQLSIVNCQFKMGVVSDFNLFHHQIEMLH
jgi:hypothetical protein